MRKSTDNVWLAGVDGCPRGWIAAFVRPSGEVGRVKVFKHFIEILEQIEHPSLVVVDIPIGLPKYSPPKGRLAEGEIRPLIGARRSSVFRVPSRSAVYVGEDATSIPNDAKRYKKARGIARKTSIDRKAFSKQGFYLFPKIVEVDKLLRANRQFVRRVYETHPEVAFWRLNDERELKHNKKSAAGIKLRKKILIEADVTLEGVKSQPPPGAKVDDLLDALACAVIAIRIRSKKAKPFPNPPPCDAYGLRMAIWA